MYLDVNKNNPDFLINGKVKKKTLVSPFTKHCESFIIIPLRKKLKQIKQIFLYNPGYIKINNSNHINEEKKN